MLLNPGVGMGSTCCNGNPSGPILREAYVNRTNLNFLTLFVPRRFKSHEKER